MDSEDQTLSHSDIRAYYTNALFDYRAAWLDSQNLSMHFGYEDGGGSTHAASLTNANRVLADIAAVRYGDRVLDAGCGLGGSSLWLARERGARVVGIALGADQVAFAQRDADRRGLSGQVRFLAADYTATPFAPASFDVVWAQESLCHATQKENFFLEAARLLAPGGRLIIADFMLKRARIGAGDEALLAEWFDGWKMPGLWTSAQHCGAAKTAGLADITVRDVTPNTVASHQRLFHRARKVQPFSAFLRRVGIRNDIQHGNVVASIRQFQALRNDAWFYGILSARKP